MNEDFMRRAIEIARQSLDEQGALPYGAVVVKDGEIIGEGLNRSHGKSDPTSHGEVEAIAACSITSWSMRGKSVFGLSVMLPRPQRLPK